jgi:hypothetical protein
MPAHFRTLLGKYWLPAFKAQAATLQTVANILDVNPFAVRPDRLCGVPTVFHGYQSGGMAA